MSLEFYQIIENAQSADNSARTQAEAQILSHCDADPATFFQHLIDTAANHGVELRSRQFCLLCLRKLVTMYWSAGFESYKGPPGVGEKTKDHVRALLLELALNDENDHKINSAASYCVVQMSAVDFPDQWPSLLQTVYTAIINDKSVNALRLLIDIFDDVVTEEMFFLSGVGMETFQIIYNFLSTNEINCDVQDAKSAALELYSICVSQLSSPLADKNKEAISNQLKEMNGVICGLLENAPLSVEDISSVTLRKNVYQCLDNLRNSCSKSLTGDMKKFIQSFYLKDLTIASHIILEGGDKLDIFDSGDKYSAEVKEYIISLVKFGESIQSSFKTVEEIKQFVGSFETLAMLSENEKEFWQCDSDEFVSVETEMAGAFSIRDGIYEFFKTLKLKKKESFLKVIIDELISGQFNGDFPRLEACVYLLNCASYLDPDEAPGFLSGNAGELELSTIEYFESVFKNYENVEEFFLCRCILAAPKFLERCLELLPDIKKHVQDVMCLSYSLLGDCDSQLVKASGLIAITYYDSFASLNTVLEASVALEIEKIIVATVSSLSEDADGDTPGALVEALYTAIKMSPFNELKFAEFQNILNVATKSPDNIQIVLLSKESLEMILKDCDTESYLRFAELAFPSFVTVLNSSNEEYSSILVLFLELITAFMKKCPQDNGFPPKVIEFILEPLLNLLARSNDEGVLQMGSEAFAFCIANSEAEVLAPSFSLSLAVIERILSFSDSASLNLGFLLVQFFNKFQNQLGDILPQIIEAVVKKFINTSNLNFFENFFGVFCFLCYSDTDQLLTFLSSMNIPTKLGSSVLATVMSLWLEGFESIRGDARIKENIVSFSQIFFNSSVDLSQVLVDGEVIPYEQDVIITRSMAKEMPTRFTQVSVYEKIVTVLAGELGIHVKTESKSESRNLGQAMSSASKISKGDEAEDGSDWEDVEDVLEYDQLNKYAEYDDEESNHSFDGSDEEDEFAEDDELDNYGYTSEIANKSSTKELLVQFFKQAASQNTHNFSDIYSRLSEKDKKVISNALL